MSGSRCILQLQGVHPFYSRKYDITKHPRYPLLADEDEGNAFEVGWYMSRNLRMKPKDVHGMTEIQKIE
jgi:type IV secretion system protein VirD4